MSDVYCDGLGACIGDCPTGALTIVERRAAAFDEAAAAKRTDSNSEDDHAGDRAAGPGPSSPALACGCPGSHEMTLKTAGASGRTGGPAEDRPSELSHWPIKLRLLSPAAPYLAGADLLLLADCAAASCPNLHERLLKGRCVALGCPKFDDVDFSIDRLADIIREAAPPSVTVVHMEVPCCHALMTIAQRAAAKSGVDVPVARITLTRTGNLIEEETGTFDDKAVRATGAV